MNNRLLAIGATLALDLAADPLEAAAQEASQLNVAIDPIDLRHVPAKSEVDALMASKKFASLYIIRGTSLGPEIAEDMSYHSAEKSLKVLNSHLNGSFWHLANKQELLWLRENRTYIEVTPDWMSTSSPVWTNEQCSPGIDSNCSGMLGIPQYVVDFRTPQEREMPRNNCLSRNPSDLSCPEIDQEVTILTQDNALRIIVVFDEKAKTH